MPVSTSVTDLFPSLAQLSPGQFQALATAAESWITRTIGRDLVEGSKTQTFTGRNQPILRLANTPVSSIQSIYVHGVLKPSTDYSFSSNGQIFKGGYGFSEHMQGWEVGVQNIVVNYTSSGISQYEQDLLIGTVMNWFYDQNKRSPIISSESIGDYSYSLNTAFLRGVPAQVMTLLQPYMRMEVV